jgi:endonuclease IV
VETCHAFAAGEDLWTKEAHKETMERFERLVRFKYLKAVHLNDSKGDLGCKLDENIGKGRVGIEGFRLLMNDERFTDIQMVLETPENAKDSVKGYRDEIELLYSLIKT